METLYKIKEKIWNELDGFNDKATLGVADIEKISMMTDIVKDICKIDRMTAEMDGESYDSKMWIDGKSSAMKGRNRGMDDMHGHSGRKRHYVAGHYSYDDGSEKHHGKTAKEKMYYELGEAAEYAETDRQREILSRAMRELGDA